MGWSTQIHHHCSALFHSIIKVSIDIIAFLHPCSLGCISRIEKLYQRWTKFGLVTFCPTVTNTLEVNVWSETDSQQAAAEAEVFQTVV